MKKNKYLGFSLGLVSLAIVVPIDSVKGLDRKDTTESHSSVRDLSEDEKLAAGEIERIKVQKDPILRFMSCLEQLVEINKYLSNSSNAPTLISSLADIPESPQEREEMLAAAAVRKNKQRTANMKIYMKQLLLKEMRNDLNQINPKFREQFKSVMESLSQIW